VRLWNRLLQVNLFILFIFILHSHPLHFI
jgi:hypothetical protein